MSKKDYSKNPWVTRTVKYAYMHSDKWHYASHLCYGKTDEEAIESVMATAIWAKSPSFRIVEIITVQH